MTASAPRARFGEQRLIRDDVAAAHRLHFRLFGVADPAHYLHNRWLRRELDAATSTGWAPTAILDAGCGGGDHTFFLARRFPGAQVLGIDIDATLIVRNRETATKLGIPNVHFEIGDLTRLAAPMSYDLVVSIDVLEHIPEQATALANLAGALRSGGLALYHIPTLRTRPVPLAGLLKEFHEWGEREHTADDLSAEEFASRVAASGLEILRKRRTFGYFTGELATSLFAVPYRNTPINRLLQLAAALPARMLAALDDVGFERTRYAVGVTAGQPPIRPTR